MTNDIEFTREGKRQRKHITLSAEVDGALDELLPDYVDLSGWLEEAAVQKLVDEHGRDAVLAAIEEAQDDLDDEQRLSEEQTTTITLSA